MRWTMCLAAAFLAVVALSGTGQGMGGWSGHGARRHADARGMGRMTRGSPVLIDPPPGAPFRDLVEAKNLSAKTGVVELYLEVGWTRTEIGGVMATLMTYNGQYPSPTIRARAGDLLRVRFRNSLPQGPIINALGHDLTVTNLHTHGLHVSPLVNSDNMMVQVKPGEEFVYEFDLSKQEPGTLNYYHPHVHGSVAEQVWSGLGGALVIEDATDALARYETHILVLKDIAMVGGVPLPHTGHMDYMLGKLGDQVMVNGEVNPVLSLRPGQIQRWRVLNGSAARFYNLALEAHAIYLIGTDGGLLDKPYRLDQGLLLSPGERVDLLVQGSATAGRYRLLSLPSGGAMCGANQQVTLMTVECAGALASDTLPALINPKAARVAMDVAALALSLAMSLLGAAPALAGPLRIGDRAPGCRLAGLGDRKLAPCPPTSRARSPCSTSGPPGVRRAWRR